MIEFLRPWVFLALPLPLAAWWLLPAAAPVARVRATESVLVLMRALQGKGDRRMRFALPLALLVTGWIALIAALAGPATSLGNLIRPSGHDLVIAIDLSASMGRRDKGTGATAFDQYRRAVAGLLEELPDGDRAALIAFGEQAFLIAPLTHDSGALTGYLDELTVGMPGRKTSVGIAIGLALKVFEGEDNGRRTLLILSDGEDNAGDLPAPDAALLAQQRGVTIHTVGIAAAESGGGGTVLRQVAELSGGTFRTLNSDTVLPLFVTGQDSPGAESQLTPLRRLWTTELLLLAAVLLAFHAFFRQRST